MIYAVILVGICSARRGAASDECVPVENSKPRLKTMPLLELAVPTLPTDSVDTSRTDLTVASCNLSQLHDKRVDVQQL